METFVAEYRLDEHVCKGNEIKKMLLKNVAVGKAAIR